MYIFRMLASVAQFISEAVMRIFGPDDNVYPLIGVQPFTGDVFNPRTAENW